MNEQETKQYEWFKKYRTHVFVRRHFPFEIGEFIQLDRMKEDFKKEIIERKSVAKLLFID